MPPLDFGSPLPQRAPSLDLYLKAREIAPELLGFILLGLAFGFDPRRVFLVLRGTARRAFTLGRILPSRSGRSCWRLRGHGWRRRRRRRGCGRARRRCGRS